MIDEFSYQTVIILIIQKTRSVTYHNCIFLNDTKPMDFFFKCHPPKKNY